MQKLNFSAFFSSFFKISGEAICLVFALNEKSKVMNTQKYQKNRLGGKN